MLNPEDVWHIWSRAYFSEHVSIAERRDSWFGWNKAFDRYIRKRLFSYTLLASEETLDSWTKKACGTLALILLLDRVARKCLRATCLAYDYDKRARSLSTQGIKRGQINELCALQQCFFVFPLIASDRSKDLELALATLDKMASRMLHRKESAETQQLVDDLKQMVQRNQLLIDRFRRYPHRAQAQGYGLNAEEAIFVQRYAWQDWL